MQQITYQNSMSCVNHQNSMSCVNHHCWIPLHQTETSSQGEKNVLQTWERIVWNQTASQIYNPTRLMPSFPCLQQKAINKDGKSKAFHMPLNTMSDKTWLDSKPFVSHTFLSFHSRRTSIPIKPIPMWLNGIWLFGLGTSIVEVMSSSPHMVTHFVTGMPRLSIYKKVILLYNLG